ncbi:DUF1911 domain-containing protein [Galbibacter sp. EGI 63066]|uniref:PoNe immunity protein domain-containing protein n=1 Tax=Galbibacter sp. EGI 63066 TaxID=2993559 RepID=UPI002248E89B|nr:PoNe immunity protein domain-containing protein [Galbibacter sp. EGI 63066]MCX2682103.1 DUF1911 domain-containing protein [Galbibacter sp. EGI 63066]
MRDNLKNSKYWESRLRRSEKFQLEDVEILDKGEIAKERINILKRSMSYSHINTLSAKYSAGYPIENLKDDLLKAIELTYESWVDDAWKIKTGKPTGSVILNQYGFGAYDQMLWMLSLGLLLNINEADFTKLVEVIDRDSVKDFLFEFIIRAKLKDRQPIIEESYREFFGIPKVFEKLRKAITETDNAKAENLIKEFTTKDWYKNHKDAGWYDSHKPNRRGEVIYFGYWSFETAAVVAIMDLDDSSFRDCQYYPKDLVDYFRENKNV